jgi:iron complex outermembrane receptor protein
LPHQPSIAWSTDLRAHLETRHGAFLNRIDLSGRLRLQRSRFGGGTAVSLGRQQLGDEIAGDPASPALIPAARSVSHVRQYGFGVSDRGRLGQWLRWNAGLLRTDYLNRISIPLLDTQTSRASPWLYNLGVGLQPVRGVEIYGSYSRGLEEAGVAPVTAANANQVLDPIMVTQKEVGVRLSPLPNLSVVTGWFDTRKPYAAIDSASGAYRFVGEVEHKGVEFSLAGKVIPQVTMVIGGVWLQPRVQRSDLPSANLRPVAVPRLRISASAEANIAAVPGLSVDGGVVATGRRAAQSLPQAGSGQLMVPATTLINAGMRYSTKVGGRELILRGQVQNLFNRFAWNVDSSETLAPVAGRHARLILSTLF